MSSLTSTWMSVRSSSKLRAPGAPLSAARGQRVPQRLRQLVSAAAPAAHPLFIRSRRFCSVMTWFELEARAPATRGGSACSASSARPSPASLSTQQAGPGEKRACKRWRPREHVPIGGQARCRGAVSTAHLSRLLPVTGDPAAFMVAKPGWPARTKGTGYSLPSSPGPQQQQPQHSQQQQVARLKLRSGQAGTQLWCVAAHIAGALRSRRHRTLRAG